MFQTFDEDYENSRYRTPSSFRRTKDSEEIQKLLDEQRERECKERYIEERTACNHQTEEQPVDPAMSNPYMDRGFTMPYQISQNRYREQVFGTKPEYNYPQEKLQPLAGRALPPNNYRPNSFTPGDMYQQRYKNNYFESPRQQQYEQRPQQNQNYESPRQQQYEQRPQQNQNYESPRQQQYEQRQQNFEPRIYRSGRPDLGFEDFRNSNVPYPQEPIRGRPGYERPPDIGFGIKYYPNFDQDSPKEPRTPDGVSTKNDMSLEDGVGPHPGWLLLLRFNSEGESQVRHALTMANKHIEGDNGRILGIARPYGVRIREGGDSWVKFGKMRYFGGGNWDVQRAPAQDETNYSVLALYFPSLTRAIQWFDRDSSFKQKDFPAPHTTDCIALPLNSSVDTKFSKTLVMTEYPRISHPEYFRDKFSVPTEDMMRKRFRASPYVVKASSIPVDDPRLRVARHLRGSWIHRNSIITLSMFDGMSEANRYFTDPEFYKCKEAQDRVSAPTTVMMDLEDWRS